MASLPPFVTARRRRRRAPHGGKLRLLSFGRLLPYKGLDLLAESLALLGPRDDLEVRVVGSGPESPELDRLRALPGVTVENRWVPEEEVGTLLAWSDALVLSHREASQSGVAATAIAARRWVIATKVGGLAEQLGSEPMALLCDPAPESIGRAIRALARAVDGADSGCRTDGRRMPAGPAVDETGMVCRLARDSPPARAGLGLGRERAPALRPAGECGSASRCRAGCARSLLSQKLIATPACPARAVRPMRWT